MPTEHEINRFVKGAPQHEGSAEKREKRAFPQLHVGKNRKLSNESVCQVLVIHHHNIPLETFRFFFTQSGYHLETAASGEQGIHKLDTERYDVVITDLRSPGIDGNRIARHARCSNGRHLFVIAISTRPLLWQSDVDLVLSNPLDIMLVRRFLTRRLHESFPGGSG